MRTASPQTEATPPVLPPVPGDRSWEGLSRLAADAARLRNSRPSEARKIAETALSQLYRFPRGEWPRAAVECLFVVGDLRFRTGDIPAVVEVLVEALDTISTLDSAPNRKNDDADLASSYLGHNIHSRLSNAYCNLGLHGQALSSCRAAVSIARKLGDPTLLAWSWTDRARIHLGLIEGEQALSAAEHAIEEAGRPGADLARLGIAHIYALMAAGRIHRFELAHRHAELADALYPHLPPAEQAGLLVAKGELALRAGFIERADKFFCEAEASIGTHGEQFVLLGALTGQAGVRTIRGDFQAVREIVQRALDLGDGSVALTLTCEQMMTGALEGLGDLQGALTWSRRAHATDRRQLLSSTDDRLELLDLEHRTHLAEHNAEVDRARADRSEKDRAASAAQYKALIEQSVDLVVLMEEDTSVRWVSPASEEILGIRPEDFIGQRPMDFVVHEDPDAVIHGFLTAMGQQGIPSTPFEYRLRHRDGSWRSLSAVIIDLRLDPAIQGLMLVGTDTTQIRRNEAMVAAQSRVLGLIARGAPLDTILAEWCSATATLCEPVSRCHVRQLDDPDPHPFAHGVRRKRLSNVAGTTVAELLVEVTEERPLATSEEAALDQMMQLAQIAFERSTAASSVSHQATHDHLTGLSNRLHFEQLTAAAINARNGDSPPLAVLFLDLDRFKLVNDSLGHAIGDRLLVEVADRLAQSLCPGDILARFGGDEFTILRPEATELPELVALAEGLIDALRRPFLIEQIELCVTVSIGITLCRHSNTDASTLIAESDSAMLRAKEQGRDCSALFDLGMRLDAAERFRSGSALRHALERDEFVLHFQPIVDLRTGRTRGHEALLRWHSEELGTVPPDQFIPLAEETGLMIPIGDWVIRRALQELAGHDSPTHMWINLSAQQLTHPSLLINVRDALEDTGVDPTRVCFEITETALTSELDTALERLSGLRDLGLSIAIDDFGTGYSSLDRLQSLPVHVLKVDRSFVAAVDSSPRRQALLSAILDLSESLGMESVVEGIESGRELAFLRETGCDMVQGFLLARPGPNLSSNATLPLDELIRG